MEDEEKSLLPAKKKKKKNLRDSLRGHEEVSVAVGQVPDGQGDGAEQEEVHGVLSFISERRRRRWEAVEKERG